MSKKAIVTGGSRGIGAAIVETLTREGFEVVFSYLSNKESAENLVQKITDQGGRAAAFQLDTSDYESAVNFVNQAKEFLTEVDV